MSSPLISVIVPCFNQADYLPEAIQSILDQSYAPIEMIVVDDGSTDDSAHLAEQIDGVRVIRQTNRGSAAARNTGFAASHGDYIVFLDGDDRLLPDAIQTAIEHAVAAAWGSAQHAPFVFGRFRRITVDGKAIRLQPPRSPSLTYRTLLRGASVGPPGVALFPRELVTAVGGFDPKIRYAEDLDFYFRICRLTDGYCHNAVTMEYRQHRGQSSYGVSRILKATLDVIDSQRDVIGDDPIRIADQSIGRKTWSRLFGQWIPIEIVRHAKDLRIANACSATWQFCRHSPPALMGAVDFARARLMNGGVRGL
ncbi:Glycosyl transferase family 2 [Limimonas halophila]|uniref:Glycosyl transferase family 2 n=1 Tax=Limimonas halophila TaxID=1082479 RepID=A0A1G7NM55_9PROT|nr:glycosyltransferase [Limimonas halophila]SDF75093.1 Glycosyl transferase family 2 [Limimonas halophila]